MLLLTLLLQLPAAPPPKPDPPPAAWLSLIGAYVSASDTLYVYEDSGALTLRVKPYGPARMGQASQSVFVFTGPRLFDADRAVFRAGEIQIGPRTFGRLAMGPADGGQLRLTPVRPVAELIEIDRTLTPPAGSGEFLAPDLVEPARLDSTILLDIRYASTNNFLGSVFYSSPRAFLQRPAAEAVVRAARALRPLGYGLLIHDAYRPWYVTKVFWDATPAESRWLVADPAQGSKHNRGAAVDITLYDLATGRPVEMPSTYDEATPRAEANFPGGTSRQRWHRGLLRQALEAEGFTVTPSEWWHFDYRDWQRYPILNRTFEDLVLPASAPSQTQARPIGDWRGYWSRANDTMPVTLHLQRDSAGKYSATFDSDRLRVSGIPFGQVEVRGSGVTMVLRGDRTTLRFQGRLRGDSLKGTFTEEPGEAGVFAFARPPASRTRPAFAERNLTWTNGDVTLAGSLLMPSGSVAVPAVVFLHGSGAEGRWASRFLATQLATHGIAALIYDKRGVGQSTGDWRQATPDDLARDAAAAVSRLRREHRIDPRRVGLHGHSQGGTLAPFVAAQVPNVAFIIASAAAGQPMDSVEIYSILNSQLPEATTAADSANARSYVAELVAAAYWGKPRARLDSLAGALKDRPWFFPPPAPGNSYWTFSKVYAQYQPLEWWAKVRVPVLLIYGAEDQRVPARESAARISGTVTRNAPDADVTVRILPGADHTFRLAPGPSGWPVTAPDYVPTLLQWLSRQ